MDHAKRESLRKPAAGRRWLCASQDSARAVSRFAFENLKSIDGVIVGMFPWCFDEVSANAHYVREFGKVA